VSFVAVTALYQGTGSIKIETWPVHPLSAFRYGSLQIERSTSSRAKQAGTSQAYLAPSPLKVSRGGTLHGRHGMQVPKRLRPTPRHLTMPRFMVCFRQHGMRSLVAATLIRPHTGLWLWHSHLIGQRLSVCKKFSASREVH